MRRGSLIIGECEAGTSQNQARRRRPGVNWWRLLLATGLFLLLASALLFSVRWLRATPRFAVTRIESSHYRYTDQPTLEALLAQYKHVNIWRVSTSELDRRVAVLPWINEVRVIRRLPGMLKVHFNEWRPVALLSGGDSDRLVLLENGQVELFPEFLPRPGLPVLAGLEPSKPDSSGRRHLGGPGAEAVIALLEAIAKTGLETVCPVDFLLSDERGFSLILRGDRGRLVVGREDFGRRLSKFLVARDDIESGGEIDLRFGNKVSID